MAPRNFADDGAVGAGSNFAGGNFGTTTPTGGTTTTDSGMSPGGGFNGTGASLGAKGVMGIGSDGNLNPSGIQGNDSGLSGGGSSGGFGGGGLASFPSAGGGGAAPITATGRSGYGGFNVPPPAGGAPTIANGAANWAAGLSFKDGGAIPDGDDDDQDPNATDPQGSAMGQSLQNSINAAMKSVQDALSYGRQLHGLGGGQQEAARMPTQPGNQSESGVPREQPMPGPLPPTSNPFGKRAAIDDGSEDTENAAMPSVPFSESQRPQPMPGPLPPTSNPFGKRGQQTSDAGSDAAPDQAIDTEEEAA